MATLTVSSLSLSDYNPDMVAADVAGDKFPNQSGVWFIIHNGSGASITATFAHNVTAQPGITGANLVATIPAGEIRTLPFFGLARFSDVDNMVQVTYSAVTTVKVGVFKA